MKKMLHSQSFWILAVLCMAGAWFGCALQQKTKETDNKITQIASQKLQKSEADNKISSTPRKKKTQDEIDREAGEFFDEEMSKICSKQELNVDLTKHVKFERRGNVYSIIVGTTEKSKEQTKVDLQNGYYHLVIYRDGTCSFALQNFRMAKNPSHIQWNNFDISPHAYFVGLEGKWDEQPSKEQYVTFQKVAQSVREVEIFLKEIHTLAQVGYISSHDTASPIKYRGLKSAVLFRIDLSEIVTNYPSDPDVEVGDLRVLNNDLFRAAYEPLSTAIPLVQDLSRPVISKPEDILFVAGSNWNHISTLYEFPKKNYIRGNQIKDIKEIQIGARVWLNQDPEKTPGDFYYEVSSINSAKDILGSGWNASEIFYFIPQGDGTLILKSGNELYNYTDAVVGTKILTDYIRKPINKDGTDVWKLAGAAHNSIKTLYFFRRPGASSLLNGIEMFPMQAKGNTSVAIWKFNGDNHDRYVFLPK